MTSKYIEYKSENEYGVVRTITGVFEIIEENDSYVKFKTKKHIVTVPWHRINKIKEEL